jgi:transposase InsO family protein
MQTLAYCAGSVGLIGRAKACSLAGLNGNDFGRVSEALRRICPALATLLGLAFRERSRPFVRTIKRDCVRVCPRSNAESVMRQLPSWIAHYNEVHPHKALGYRSLREFMAAHERP